jgi:hypothetical protein
MTAEADVAAYLETLGLGVVNETIFVNNKPATPNAIICIFGYAGQPPEWTNTIKIDRPGVQVLVRGAKDAAGAARDLIETIFEDLDGLADIVLNADSGVVYQCIEATQSGPSPMGKDENGRIEYVTNFYVTKTR